MQTGKYTGIGLIGNENIAAIYAVNNGIVDINGTGIYHCFIKLMPMILYSRQCR